MYDFWQIVETVFRWFEGLGLWVSFVPLLVLVFSGVHYFLPRQHDFSSTHEKLIKQLLERRAKSLKEFISQVNSQPKSIMEKQDPDVVGFLGEFDTYFDISQQLNSAKKTYYRSSAALRRYFFFSIGLIVLSLPPYTKLVVLVLTVVFVFRLYRHISEVSSVQQRLHNIATLPQMQ